MRHDAVLWIQWQAEILAVVFLFHWRTLNLLSEAIRLETFIECSLDFGCIGIEVFVEELVCYIKRTKMFECECKWLPVSWNNIQYIIVWKVEMEFIQHILYLN